MPKFVLAYKATASIDVGSTNGTFVNGRILDRQIPHLLQCGDEIRIGSATFVFEASSPAFRGPLEQESSLEDDTVQLSVSEYRAPGRGVGVQPPNPPSSPWVADVVTGYGMPDLQQSYMLSPGEVVFQQTYTPPPVQSYMPPAGVAISQQPYSPPPVWPVHQSPYTPPPVKPKSSKRLKALLIGLVVILVLSTAGGGIAAYLLTRPQPVMSVTSDYRVASIPAGSTGTILHISAHSFSGSSAITFLLDNVPLAGSQNVQSDADGNVRADLTVTNAWTVGKYALSAKDASGYTTKAGVTVAIVPQGQAHTPGPNGAPPDDMSFTLAVNGQIQDAGTGQQIWSGTETLQVAGKPDPSGGTVCQAADNGQPYTYTGSSNNGLTYRETIVSSCSGTYKGGKVSYIETATTDKIDYSNGVSCVARVPYVYEHLEGTFTSQNAISGTLSTDSVTMDCNHGIGSLQINAGKGSWTAQL